MLSLTQNYSSYNSALAKQPVYVAEIFWNNGKTGTPGINDIYFATCDVNKIVNFPYPNNWFPVLKSDSIGSMSQQVDPINGVSTIGNITLTMTDYKGFVSNIIKAADAAGHGLRRQRITIYMLFKGMDWADKVRIRTMQVQDLKLSRLNEYTITAADVQKQLQKTLFNPFQTVTSASVAASGAVTVTVNDARNFKLATSVTYGNSGFILVDSEIMRWTASTTTAFTVAAPDRGLFGTTAAAHAIGASVSEIIYLNENPITMILKIIESSGIASTNGIYDAYPAHWGCGMDSTNDVQESDWLSVGQLLSGLSATPASADGLQFEFIINKGITGKKFIEDSILKILGAFGFVRGDGKYSVRSYNDIANAAKENCAAWLTVDNVVQWGDLSYNYQNLANELWIDYDEEPKLSNKYIRSTLFIDPVSKKKWGDAKQLKYSAQGIPPTSVFINQLYQRFQRVLSRYSRPPMQITLTLLPKMKTLEIGDMVRVSLPIRDLLSSSSLDRAFEVISTQLTPGTGESIINCIAQPEQANFWFQGVGSVTSVTISPSVVSIPTGTTQQIVLRCFDASGLQIQPPAVSWLASGNVSVGSTGLVTAGAVGTGSVTAVVGAIQSNAATITVTASANSNTVISVAVSPSLLNFSAGQTQLATAVPFDIAGAMVNGKTFTWASTNSGVASVPAGPSTSATITAVANGTCNITATETGSSVVSPACAVTVAAAVTPTYTPPSIADNAYKIGTQITSMGGVGGPHTIPNGYNFASGDYWFDGNVTLPLGNTCTVNGTVRIFSLGIITINGTIDGAGRGVAATAGYPWLPGFVGVGGTGGWGIWSYGSGWGGGMTIAGSTPINQTTPTLSVIGLATSGGSWTSISGLPLILYGSQSTDGLLGIWSGSGTFGIGGTSGAGLLFMARGIYITTGQINLNGANGTDGSITGYNGGFGIAGGGGGGGGGSFIGLAEKNSNGLPVMSILSTRINISGGLPGNSISHMGAGISLTSSAPATPGGPGAIITQVIG